MRASHSRNGISLKSYAGTTGVLLSFNVTAAKREGLLGFAIEREGGGRGHRWLRSLLKFPGESGARIGLRDSKDSPIQKFRWSDYSVYPGRKYRYKLHGVYGRPDALRLKAGGEVEVKTESLNSGLHRVIFNRAAAASQAYARRFGDANPEKPRNQVALDWLSRGLREKLLAYLERARDAHWAIDVAIYEFELPEVARALREARRRGAEVRIVYHAKSGDPQTKVNEDHIRALPAGVKVGRTTSKIFHQKFIVLSRVAPGGPRRPVSVLSGSTNFTPNGVYRQANVIHIVEDTGLAAEYSDLFENLFSVSSSDRGLTKRFINKNDPILPAADLQAVFSPRGGLTDLREVSTILRGAKRDVIFCTAFRLHDLVTEALSPAHADTVIRYGLQNQRSSITGTHRRAQFVTKAFLKSGLEGFLKESTAGQKGNILIHLKTIVCDFTTDRPVIISGSNNFSKSASEGNDENMLIVRDEPFVADTYGCEMMRFYAHYRFRFNQTSRTGRGPLRRLTLSPDDSWTDRYFKPGSLLALERIRFNGSG